MYLLKLLAKDEEICETQNPYEESGHLVEYISKQCSIAPRALLMLNSEGEGL